MFDKKSNIGKKGNILNISGYVLVFSFVSIIYLFIAIFMFASANDYLFYNLQNITEEMENIGAVQSGTAALTQNWGNDYTNYNLHLDDFWLFAYVVFLISSFIVAYRTRRQNYFSFLGYLFYGIMFILYILTFFSIITNWFNENILMNVIPSAIILLPKFYYYLNHIGIFSAIQLGICLLLNQVDLNFAKIIQSKKKEEAALKEDEEIL